MIYNDDMGFYILIILLSTNHKMFNVEKKRLLSAINSLSKASGRQPNGV